MSPAAMYFPLRFGDTHEHLGIFDGNPTGEDFHDVLKVGFEDNVTHAVNKGSRGCVQDVQALAKCPWIFRRISVLP